MFVIGRYVPVILAGVVGGSIRYYGEHILSDKVRIVLTCFNQTNVPIALIPELFSVC